MKKQIKFRGCHFAIRIVSQNGRLFVAGHTNKYGIVHFWGKVSLTQDGVQIKRKAPLAGTSTRGRWFDWSFGFTNPVTTPEEVALRYRAEQLMAAAAARYGVQLKPRKGKVVAMTADPYGEYVPAFQGAHQLSM